MSKYAFHNALVKFRATAVCGMVYSQRYAIKQPVLSAKWPTKPSMQAV